MEVDYIPGEERHLLEILEDYPFDFVLGSIHYIGNNFIATKVGFENFLAGRGIIEGIEEYWHLWKKGIETGLFDVMAHPDYFRRSLYQMGVPDVSFKEYESSSLRGH
ncbi:MAG: histidinol-phosphatase family [Thermoproteota archaeon]|nr:histidinol-phosphatase family [Thermoproteota archaeon]